MHRLSFLFFSLCALVASASAQFSLAGRAPATRAELISEVKTIAPGATFSVALRLNHPRGWHSYYQNSGGVEQPPSIGWQLPEGFSAGPIQWPVPEVKEGVFGKSFVHTGSPVFLVDLTAPASLETGTSVSLTASAAWQICEDSCISEKKTFTLTLPVGAVVEPDPSAAELFAKARANQPGIRDDWKVSAKSDGGDVVLRVEPRGALEGDPTDFIPDQPFVKSVSAGGSIERQGNAWLIRLKRATKDVLENDIPQGDAMSGILIGPRPVLIAGTAIARESAGSVPRALPFSRFLPILGGMLLGGLILNLMPCVFPVIGLKIMGFVRQAGADRGKIVLHGVTFVLGVLASFGVLSGILFAARAAAGGGADAIGWGYQLQNPWVVLSLLLLMFVLALNMFGVFELGTSISSAGGSLQAKQGLAGSFSRECLPPSSPRRVRHRFWEPPLEPRSRCLPASFSRPSVPWRSGWPCRI